MVPTLVLDVVGLTSAFLDERMPALRRLKQAGTCRSLKTVLPAVTCSVQASFVTGAPPSAHGVVGNGWYFRELSEIWFWRQSNALVAGEKIWEAAKKRDPAFRCAKLFWWYNMYSSVDVAVTPRPLYPADGRKIPDIYTQPPALRDELNARLGAFPLFDFWGPTAGIRSSRWIADCALHVMAKHQPTLTLVYLPHLDYSLQRLGPDHPAIAAELGAIDAVCGELIHDAEARGARVIVLSEYGITKVRDAVHLNRVLRREGLLSVRSELGLERLDAGASDAFAVADHQLAHVYVRDASRIPAIKSLLEGVDGVAEVLDAEGKREAGLDHARAGELVALSRPDRWFSYYYWLDDDKAPDFARTVDIHRKPGYDPVELFLDPSLRLPKLAVGLKLARKMLGFRYLMDVIPLDTALVRGSHGLLPARAADGPVFLSNTPHLVPEEVGACDVKDVVLRHLFDA
jgi:predicted AlkP superfamily pyrophosphatase or phosphodiesterase